MRLPLLGLLLLAPGVNAHHDLDGDRDHDGDFDDDDMRLDVILQPIYNSTIEFLSESTLQQQNSLNMLIDNVTAPEDLLVDTMEDPNAVCDYAQHWIAGE